MKKLLILLVLFSVGIHAQSKMTVPTPTSKSFYWKNGNGKIIPVKFQNFSENGITKELLSTATMTLLSDAQFNLKLKNSFVPISVQLMDSEDGNYIMVVEYLGNNLYGATLEQKTFYTFGKTLIKGKYMNELQILDEFNR